MDGRNGDGCKGLADGVEGGNDGGGLSGGCVVWGKISSTHFHMHPSSISCFWACIGLSLRLSMYAPEHTAFPTASTNHYLFRLMR